MYSVYKLTLPDGRAYVGMTSNKPCRRWSGGSGYIDNIPFYHEIQYFGWKNITKEILEEVPDKETALERESYYIGLYKTYLLECGFNTYWSQKKKDKYVYILVELGLEFNTLEQAGKYAGLSAERIRQAIKSGKGCGKQKYHFIKVKV